MNENKETAEQINEDLSYLFGKINWGASFIDAKAARIMNELTSRIQRLEQQNQTDDPGGKHS